MTNGTAAFLAIAIFSALLIDYVWFEWSNTLFLAIKFDELLEWLAFWR